MSGIFSLLRSNSKLSSSVFISSSPNWDVNRPPSNTVDGNTNTHWHSTSMNGAWIMYTLVNFSLEITGYYMCNRVATEHHLLYWKLEGQKDNSDWVIIDEQSNNVEFGVSGKKMNFTCTKGLFHAFRLTQTGVCNLGTYYFTLAEFDLYGTLHPMQTQNFTSFLELHPSHYFPVVFVIFIVFSLT